MRNMMHRFAVLLAAVALTLGAWAASWYDSTTGYTWYYSVTDGKAEIWNDYSCAVSPKPSGALAIPSTLKGCPVTSIGEWSFEYCSGLTSVTIPSSVTSIGCGAFGNCSGLTSVTIPSSVTNICDSVFWGCSGLTSVTIPSSVTDIRSATFSCCSSLTSVTIPSSVTNIEINAFAGCSGLTSVTIPSSVTSVGGDAFYACSGLMSFSVDSANPNYSSRNGLLCSKDGTTLIRGVNGDVVIPPIVTSIGEDAFSGCSALTSVTIPSSVTNIGVDAFSDCIGLTSVTIPSSVTSIGECAFAGCSGLTSVTISEGVTNIGGEAFSDCIGLTSVTIPSSVTSIGDEEDAFRGCSGLTSISVDPANPNYSSRNGMLCSKDGSLLIQGVNGDVTIPSSVRSIEAYAFSGCSGLTSVTIPSSVTSIGDYAFEECENLKTVYVTQGDGTRVRNLLAASEFDVSGVTFRAMPSPAAIPYAAAAVLYDGYFRKGDAPAGTVQVKVAKMARGSAKVTATVQIGATKLSFKGGVADAEGKVSAMSAGGHTLSLTLGRNGLGGALDGVYAIDGARNFFTSKDKAEKAAADALVKKMQGAVNVILPDGRGVLTVSIAAKGKVKVSGTVAGAKVSATSQLLIGADACAIPVVITKKADLAFVLWLDEKGAMSVDGVEGAIVGKAGALQTGAALRLDPTVLEQALPGLYADYLPDGLSVSAGAKWVVAGGAKAGKVAIDKKTGEIDEAKLGANPSGLKLTYTAKTGAFKGSFKAYALEKGKIKAYTVNIEGVMVGNKGYGSATIKNPPVSIPVTIE